MLALAKIASHHRRVAGQRITSSNRPLRSISRKTPLEVRPTIAAAIGRADSKAWSSAAVRALGIFLAAGRAPLGAAERLLQPASEMR